MSATQPPTLEEFLAAPIDDIAEVVPASMLYTPGGTRREAVFRGIYPWSDEYVTWTRKCSIECFHLIFRHGISHIFTGALIPGHFQEVNRYRSQLLERVNWAVAGPESIADYIKHGWRARLIGAENVPELLGTAQRLVEQTPTQSKHTVWWSVTPHVDSPWIQIFEAVHRHKIHTRTEAIKALYGEEIPLISLLLSFGKPTVALENIPPLLMGKLHCYWSQRAGYSLNESIFRSVLYDYAYRRNTWQEEKLDRAKEALHHRRAWERGPIIGLGTRLGPFWYPTPTPSWEALEE